MAGLVNAWCTRVIVSTAIRRFVATTYSTVELLCNRVVVRSELRAKDTQGPLNDPPDDRRFDVSTFQRLRSESSSAAQLYALHLPCCQQERTYDDDAAVSL